MPAGGATLSFWIDPRRPAVRRLLLRSRHARSAPTTGPRCATGAATRSSQPAFDCRGALKLHPFLAHYLSDDGRDVLAEGAQRGHGTRRPFRRRAASAGPSTSRYAGRSVELALSYYTDDAFQFSGVAVDDVVVSGARGLDVLRGRRRHARRLDRPGRARREHAERGRLDLGHLRPRPRSAGDVAQAAVAREPEIVDFLASVFGPYPFSTVRSIVDDPVIGFALENQTRPIYSRVFFEDRGDPEIRTR